MSIADGDIPNADVDRLIGAITRKNAALVVSFAHVSDVHRRTDHDTRRSFAAVVDRFPRKLTFLENPAITEGVHARPLLLARAVGPIESPPDLRTRRFDRYDALVEDPAFFASFGEILTMFGEATQKAHSARAGTPVTADQAAVQRLALHALRDSTTLRDMVERISPGADPVERARIEQQLRPLESMIAGVHRMVRAYDEQVGDVDKLLDHALKRPADLAIGSLTMDVPGGLETWERIGPHAAPGLFLIRAMEESKLKDRRREPELSDLIDRLHVGFVPYCDVSTLDRENVHHISRALPRTRSLRRGLVTTNNARSLDEVIALVEAL